jgi:hypothetical protein
MGVNGATGDGQFGEAVGPYRVLDTATRRRAAVVYLAIAVIAGLLVIATDVGAMWLTVVSPLIVLAIVQVAGGWRMQVRDVDAIRLASDHASFDVGHGSATLGFRGPLAKPVWQVLVFADGPAPDRQALITVDALSGDVRGSYEEPVSVP